MRHMKTSDQTQAILFGKLLVNKLPNSPKMIPTAIKNFNDLEILESGFSVRKIKFDSLKLN